MTPNSKKCMADCGVIADNASVRVLQNVIDTARDLIHKNTTDARAAKRCLLLALAIHEGCHKGAY